MQIAQVLKWGSAPISSFFRAHYMQKIVHLQYWEVQQSTHIRNEKRMPIYTKMQQYYEIYLNSGV